MNANTERLANLIHATATSLWDVSGSILATGYAMADDWELARAAASHLLLALEHPPAPDPPSAQKISPPRGIVSSGKLAQITR